MAQLVCYREALSPQRTRRIYSNYCLVAETDDPSFTSAETFVLDLRVKVISDSLKINFLRLGNSELLEKRFGLAQDGVYEVSSGGIALRSIRSSKTLQKSLSENSLSLRAARVNSIP